MNSISWLPVAVVQTLVGRMDDTRKGNRPSFSDAAEPQVAEPLYERFCPALEHEGVSVARGRFGARMEVSPVNDGPVTVVLDP